MYGYVWNNPMNSTDPLGLDGWGNDTAEWWDNRLGVARDFWGGGDFPVAWAPGLGTMTFWGGLGGLGDMLRCGSGSGQAYYGNENVYGIAAFAAMDVSRCSALFAALAGPFAKGIPNRGAAVPIVEGESCPTRSFNPFKGKTPPEIDQLFRKRGYQPMGPDPMNGKGNYVNPRGRGYHVDANHPPPKPPHIGVHRSRGKRNNMGPREFPL
jgi:hypothetical protein